MVQSKKILCSFVVFFLIFLSFGVFSYGAEIKGEVYDLSFDQVKDVFISINSTPKQQFVSKDGMFLFNLEVGEYIIEFKRYEKNTLTAVAKESIIINNNNGEYMLDVVLLPTLDDTELLFESGEVDLDLSAFADNNESFIKEEEVGKNNILASFLPILFLLAVFLLIVFGWKIIISRMVKTMEHEIENEDISLKDIKKNVEKDEPSKTEVLENEDLKESRTVREDNLEEKAKYDEFVFANNDYRKEIMTLIKKEERITQKDLRKKIPLSEAKISLIVSELYEEGKIKKIKKGRGNILVYKKEDSP